MTAVRYPLPAALATMPVRGHHVVEASAGTGKTFLIEHRILQLVASGAAALEDILVVTFTDKATAELRTRVRELLARARAAREHGATAGAPHIVLDDAARRRIGDALLGFDGAAIFTIHGFCHRVLTDSAFETRRLFDQSQVSAETAFAGAFRGALRELFAADPGYIPHLRAYLEAGGTADKLESLLLACEQQPGVIAPAFDPDAIRRAAGEVVAALAEIGGADAAVAAYREAGVATTSAKGIGRRLAALAPGLDRPDADSALALVGALDRKELAWVLDRVPARAGDGGPLARLGDALRELDRSACSLEAAAVHTFLPEVRARLRRDKASRGELDFGDMLRLVWESLEGAGGADLARRLRRRYPVALIDEFQDTDPVQWSIFRRLYLEGDGACDLSIIGDPKQAIYSFRGADVATYLRACREVVQAGGGAITLPENHRSAPAVVHATNRLVGPDRGEPFFTGGIRYDDPVAPARSIRATTGGGDDVAPVRVFRLVAGERKATADDVRRAVIRRIGGEIGALVGDRPIWIGEDGERRRLEARDVFVLTRNRTESDEVAAELRRRAIPCALYKQEGLLSSEEAVEVLELLRGIAEPERRSARYRAWQTRFFAVSLSDLPALGRVGDAHPLVARLYEWRALAAAHRYEELFSRILADSGVVERELFAGSSERSLTNFLHVFEVLLDEVTRSRCEIHELVQRLLEWKRASTTTASDDLDLQRLESEASAVQIMTIHKSKGLEAGVVFLLGGLTPPGPGHVSVYHDGGERVVHVGRPGERVKRSVDEEVAAENQRLLYVAITRAVARLYLPYIPESVYPVKGAYAALNERLAEVAAAGEAGDGDVRARFEVEDVPVARAPAPEVADTAGDALAGWEPPAELLALPEPDSEPLRAAREERRGFVITSYTRMKRRAEDARAATAEPISDLDFKTDGGPAQAHVGDDELPPGAASGVFLHELLEHLDFSTAVEAPDLDSWRERDDVSRIVERSMLRHDCARRHRDHAERMVHAALTTPVAAGGVHIPSLARGERPRREVEFLYPFPGPGERGFVKGFIDLVFAWEGRVYLLDWKSDALPDYGAEALRGHVENHYALQARLYALALIKMLHIEDAADHDARFGGVIYWFLRGARPDGCGIRFARPDRDELVRAERELADAGVG